MTLNLTEGAGAADTAVGTFKVAYTAPGSGGIADGAGNNAASFAATAPTDKAAPGLTLLQMFDTDDGRQGQPGEGDLLGEPRLVLGRQRSMDAREHPERRLPLVGFDLRRRSRR